MKFLITLALGLSTLGVFAQGFSKHIEMNHNGTCVVTSQDKLYCWGDHRVQLLPDENSEATPHAVDVFPKVIDVQLGLTYACALSPAGEVKCWGEVPGKTSYHKAPLTKPTKIDFKSPVKSIGVGWEYVCALLTTGEMSCFGKKDLTSPQYQGTEVPWIVPLGQSVKQFEASAIGVCALLVDESLWCWGGSRGAEPAELKLGVSGIKSFSAHNNDLCVTLFSGKVMCWPYDTIGKNPKSIPGLGDEILQVRSSGHTNCAVTKTGKVKCWGQNSSGTLGPNERLTKSESAVEIAGIEGATDIEMYDDVACAELKNSHVKCWGGGFRYLGNGSQKFLPPYEVKLP